MTFNTRIAQSAVRLADHFGTLRNFTRTTDGTYDPSTSTTPQTESTFTGTGGVSNFKAFEIDGERIKQGDIKLVLSAMDTPPQVDDVVDIDGINYKVMEVMAKIPAGTRAGYVLHLRV